MSLVSAMTKSTCTPMAMATRVPWFCSLQILATAAATSHFLGSWVPIGSAAYPRPLDFILLSIRVLPSCKPRYWGFRGSAVSTRCLALLIPR